MQSGDKTEQLIIALDVSTQDKALELVRLLKECVGYFKVGLQLFTACGPGVIEKILDEKAKVFLDLKLHDIPNTAAHAALEAARRGVHMMTLHTQGGEAMMRQARETLYERSQQEGWPIPKLLGVTVLTSLDQAALVALGVKHSLDEQVLQLAESACRAGLDGVVSSPKELRLFQRAKLDEMICVTAGIRPRTARPDDQARTMTPAEALAEGADYLVIGRPITRAADPAAAARTILEEMHL